MRIIFAILSIIFILWVITIIITDNLDENNHLYEIKREEIIQYNNENMLIKDEIASASAYTTIKKEAERMGFIKGEPIILGHVKERFNSL